MPTYIIADIPTTDNPTPLKEMGSTADLECVICDEATEIIVEIPIGGGVVLGTWQGSMYTRINVGVMIEEVDTDNHQSYFEAHLIDGEYEVLISEPPFIAMMHHQSRISGSLTIT